MESRPSESADQTERGQFIHLEKYARSAPYGKPGENDIEKVACEAARVQGHCGHVEHPVEPTLLYGVSPLVAKRMSEEWTHAKFTPYLHKASGTTKRRRYRKDQPCALVGVVSAPPEMKSGQAWPEFKRRTILWLKAKFGDRLKSVIEHTDEPQLHMHFWVVPRAGEDFSAIHQGVKAVKRLPRAANRFARDVAYKAAMSALQDEFFTSVAKAFGLRRTTVGGVRLTRKQLDRKRAQEASEAAAFERGVAEAAEEKDALRRQVAELKVELARVSACAAPAQQVGVRYVAATAKHATAPLEPPRTTSSPTHRIAAPTPFDEFHRPFVPRPR